MALVREPTLYDGFDAEVSSFDALGYHTPLLDEGGAAAALLGGYYDAGSAFTHAGCADGGSSVLAFDVRAPAGHDREADCDVWIDTMDQAYGASTVDSPALAAQYHAAGSLGMNDDGPFGLLYPSTSPGARASQKRPYAGAELQTTSPKMQCGASRKAKPKSAPNTPPKDPQSLAAKNRRERISERLKILQELVPNGTKVDLVTMLEKAISYVKFLQLQVKVLATDEFWPAQGGKAPEISQVKEALDAILSSQRTQSG